ncbi:thiopeptide-type bacteriocin biosynthesis protein [Flavobacterium glaciei]|uniref:Thiopeptide-type bacteriocin biosynthesis protein n=1 Tax=Flavobacterium glaciei TaxID=386300 RepID=A0A562PQX5_9FLAO|nr:thiopeptide-type bacteriocin biosynthesis protein [Flavobacterium glaciei]RDI53565.1 thiopeptide-type bacteriocin biosynthesis protein [Flavobacterium glaciei]TWI46466.1 thiopeptide-type bacteriocin biosynthesis protein [Flavobacterium glaciei]
MKRDFCIGSEWLYYKIYTGVKTADLVLLEKLYPVILDLQEEKIICKWFFIRYKDPDEHLRIRFYCKTPENVSTAIARMYPVLNLLLEKNSIWKVQTDTYQREIERYGEKTMIDSEKLFWYDSEMIMQYLTLKPSFERNEAPLLFSFTAIDTFLNSFGLSNFDKLFLMDKLQLAFKKEFDADKSLRKELDKEYRALSQDIDDFLTGKAQNQFPQIFKIIQDKKSEVSAVIVGIPVKLQMPLLDFLSSHIHMMVNRHFTSRQRKYELIIYDHLYRYYKIQVFKRTL